MLGQDRHPDPEQAHPRRPVRRGGVTADEVILDGALASRADDDDTIDLAVLGGLKDHKALHGYGSTHFQPFDPVHKRTEATVTGAGRQPRSR